MRHRLITFIDALLVGMILGLLFVTLVHASPVSASQRRADHWTAICHRILQSRP